MNPTLQWLSNSRKQHCGCDSERRSSSLIKLPFEKKEHFIGFHSHFAFRKTAHDACLCAVGFETAHSRMQVKIKICSELKSRQQNYAFFFFLIITWENLVHYYDRESKQGNAFFIFKAMVKAAEEILKNLSKNSCLLHAFGMYL